MSTAPSTTTVDSSDRSYQNPIYGTSEFSEKSTTVDDRTLYNPLYEQVEATVKVDDEISEKIMPTLEDFIAPTGNKPLVATTTAAGTTTMHGGEYKPSSPVPMDVASDPVYATVIPKSKRATAKPFAADGDESDEEI